MTMLLMFETPLSNTPAGRRFFGGFLMGGSSVRRVIKFLGGVQQNWAGQCEMLAGRAVVSETRYAMTNDQRSLLIPELGSGPGQSSGGVQGQSPWKLLNFEFSSSWEWPKISKHPTVYSTTKETKIAFPLQCHFSLFYNCLVRKRLNKKL